MPYSIAPMRPMPYQPIHFGRQDVTSNRVQQLSEPIIGQIVQQATKADAVNLGQGNPSDLAPQALIDATQQDLIKRYLPYSPRPGVKEFQNILAEKTSQYLNLNPAIDPQKEVTVTIGATEALASTIFALVNPGDEVAMFSPYYETFEQLVVLAGGKPTFVHMDPKKNWDFNKDELEKTLSTGKVKLLILNTPNSPTGKVFTPEELAFIADLCKKNGIIVASDETYQHLLFDGRKHHSIAAQPGMRDRTIIISSLSKDYSAPGLRTGWAIAPEPLTKAIRKIHANLSNSAPFLSQAGGIAALKMPESYYDELIHSYQARRDKLMQVLEETGFKLYNPPEGAFYITANVEELCQKFGVPDADTLVKDILIPGTGPSTGVAMIPGSALFADEDMGRYMVRISFCKEMSDLDEFGKRMHQLLNNSPTKTV